MDKNKLYEFDARNATNACVRWIYDWFHENGKGCNAVVGISGGKDSTVVAALCARALGPEHVMGVMLPNGIQPDINDSKEAINFLCINGIEMDISPVIGTMKSAMTALATERRIYTGMLPELTRQAEENLPPRIRMSALYMVAQSCNGRVSNNCNYSENWIGYSTIYGDTAGDFSPISCFTVGEGIEIGRQLGIPEHLLIKPPADGLCGKTDEANLGFTYAVLDRYLRTGEIEDLKIKKMIDMRHEKNKFKHMPMAAFRWDAQAA